MGRHVAKGTVAMMLAVPAHVVEAFQTLATTVLATVEGVNFTDEVEPATAVHEAGVTRAAATLLPAAQVVVLNSDRLQ